MSKQHKCETCGQKVQVEGKTTQYYVGKEREIARLEMLDEIIQMLKKKPYTPSTDRLIKELYARKSTN